MKKQLVRKGKAGTVALLILFALLFLTILGRFLYIQITGEVNGQVLAAKAEQRYKKEKALEGNRGSILDRNGKVIAEDTISYKLVAVLDENLTTNTKKPNHVVDLKMTAEKLANYIDLDETEIYQILSKEGRKQVEFGKAGRDISNKTKSEIDKEELPGITFIRDTKRFYPNGVFASHLIGYAEREEIDGENKIVGKLGLEKSLQDYLEGENGKLTYKSDRYGYILPYSIPEVVPEKSGNDIYLTIDKKIQTFLEDSLDRVAKDYSPKKLLAIVADPKTGEILAMSQRPTFHPKTKVGLEDTWHNELIESPYEPGSTMKIFTLAAAINEGKYNGNETFKSGSYTVGPDTIRDHNRVGWGNISFLEGVQRSSNVAFSKLVMEKLGPDNFYNYLLKFGFDKKTDINLPGEVPGKILYNYPIEKVTTSFGQGTILTPIQQIQAMTAIANDGKMMKPQIIKKIVDHNDNSIIEEVKEQQVGTPISSETAKEVLNILSTVITSPVGTGRAYSLEGYEVAGKTGTAQIPGPDGRYLTGANNYIFSFLGAAPKENPELIMYVAIQQPELNGRSGSEPLSAIFKTVMQHSLQYLNIKPDEIAKKEIVEISNFVNQTKDLAVSTLTEKGINPIVIGNGTNVIEQVPKAGTPILDGEKVILKTDGDLTMPDLTGWSLRDTLKVANFIDAQFSKTGNGYVTKQSIPPGSIVNEQDYLVVELETPRQSLENKNNSDEDLQQLQGA